MLLSRHLFTIAVISLLVRVPHTLSAQSPGGRPRVIYASSFLGSEYSSAITPGSTTFGVDAAPAINRRLANGNIHLYVDGHYGLGAPLVVDGNTTISVLPGCGFIMLPKSNSVMLQNAHPSAPTQPSGTGGFVVSNLRDTNITIEGGLWNQNADNGAMTGKDKRIGSDGFFAHSMRFSGVNNLTLREMEIYNSAAFGIEIGNSLNIHIDHNWMHQPAPLQVKNNGTIQFEGPDQYIWISDNRINAGDDAIALNADDGQDHNSGDPDARFMPAYYLQGPITDAWIDRDAFDNSSTGIRLLSCHERVTRIFVSHLSGSVSSSVINISTFYKSIGDGNFGSISIDGLDVSSNKSSIQWYPTSINLDANIEQLSITHVNISNAYADWPVLFVAGHRIETLSLHDFAITTHSTQIPALFQTNGAVQNLDASGVIWTETADSAASLFGGSAPPQNMSFSNYVGPARIFAPGYQPKSQSGKALCGN